MKKILSYFVLACALMQPVAAQQFEEFFTDNTLRLDYIFAGDAKEQTIAIDELLSVPRWYGKRARLADVPVEGNGQIIVRSHKDSAVIYRQSFSTLFQEWLTYDEAATTKKAFENVFLVPMPRDTVTITVELYNNRRETTASFTHRVAPNDILIRRIGDRPTRYTTLQQATDTTRCIHIAFIAEGYQAQEMDVFRDDCRKATEALFSHEPFRSMRTRFHVIAVEAPSTDSGTSEPKRGIWRDTALRSHFDTFYSDRYLTTLRLKDLHNWLAGTPYEHIIVLVNTKQYGGGGILNSYNLSMTHHAKFMPVVVHEFGHSFAGLGDEYAYEHEALPVYPHDIEPWEPNLTTLTDFRDKWESDIRKGTPVPTPEDGDNRKAGLYEGAGYSMKGIYRGYQDCRMRTNEHPEFCPACQKAIRNLIDFYTQP